MVKSSYMKEMLVREFGCDIGFHVSQRKNQSEVVYDTIVAVAHTLKPGQVTPKGSCISRGV